MKLFAGSPCQIARSWVRNTSSATHRALFKYTSGCFLFNENIRLSERHVPFDIHALSQVVANAANRPPNELASLTKIAEGGFNRVLQATFADGHSVLARIPYSSTAPKGHAVASEAATLHFLHARGFAVPKVLAYSPDEQNSVGVEYLVLEKLDGVSLGERWFIMDGKARVKIMRQFVDLENRVMGLGFPASGNLYFRGDLKTRASVSLHRRTGDGLEEVVIGPTVQHAWWYGQRSLLDIDRGPWTDFLRRCIVHIVHFYYAALTMKQMPDHFDALRNENTMLRAKLFERSGAPWEGDDVSLRYALLQACVNWPMSVPGEGPTESIDCPIQVSKDEAQSIKDLYEAEEERNQVASEIRDVIGIDAQGWVPDDEQLERARELARQIKKELLEHSEAEIERVGVREHFPFGDHE
ncbi:kinase-like domain-containing protein [Aspergillus aurantiobrunneus]